MSKAILFLNGRINIDFCQKYIEEQALDIPVFCTDGAYNKLQKSEKITSMVKNVIGDFDSFLGDTQSPLFVVNADQYSTDFEKALEFLLVRGFKKVLVFGVGEGEMDHFLSNMSIAKKYKNKIDLEFVDEYSHYFFIPKNFHIQGVLGKMFSVLPFCKAEDIYYKGLKYPLDGETLSLGESTGIRNHAVSDKVEIKYANGDIILFISHKNYKD